MPFDAQSRCEVIIQVDVTTALPLSLSRFDREFDVSPCISTINVQVHSRTFPPSNATIEREQVDRTRSPLHRPEHIYANFFHPHKQDRSLPALRFTSPEDLDRSVSIRTTSCSRPHALSLSLSFSLRWMIHMHISPRGTRR
jgi:hypothetical protein